MPATETAFGRSPVPWFCHDCTFMHPLVPCLRFPVPVCSDASSVLQIICHLLATLAQLLVSILFLVAAADSLSASPLPGHLQA